ncbi:hypothetical protein [Streptomyces sp. NPDC020742]|uniref:hypothetical protein n=1 Tax=Streptomyces sp. NPDC020742 TaxID=3154897 RepID=UPI0033CC684D
MTSASRPGHRTARTSAQHRLRREVPCTAAVLADERDFRAMRRYRTFAFDDHRGYLRQMETLLRTLTAQGVLTTLSLFDPAAYETYCADLALDPDRPESRTRYTAEAARTGATVTYEGEPLSRLIPLLVEEAGRQAAWRHASALLAGAGRCEECGADLAHAAFARATHALQQLLTALGDGTQHLVCSLGVGAPPLVAALHPTTRSDTPAPAAESESLIFCTVLAAGLAMGTPGGIVSRTTTDDSRRDTVRGWALWDSWLRPLTASEVFAAYCTDADTGEPIPPEHGVVHAPGLPLIPPPDLHGPH